MSQPTKRFLKRAVVTGVVAFLLLVVALIAEIHRLEAITPPESSSAPGGETALLVLDIQEEYTGPAALPPFPYPGSAQLIDRVNQIAKRSAESGVHVLYVRQVYSRPLSRLVSWLLLGGRGWPGSSGSELDHRLRLASSDIAEKSGADAFSSARVRQFMATHHIGKVWVIGLDGTGCVDRTARGARARGLSVSILDDAVASLDAAKLRALRVDYAREHIATVPSSARLGAE
jgi:nicotinamidase-related amidase